MICINCNKQADYLKTVVINGEVIDGCEHCLNTSVAEASGVAKYNRDWQRAEYRKSIIQPNQPRDFVRAYGEKAREYGYSDEQLRKYS